MSLLISCLLPLWSSAADSVHNLSIPYDVKVRGLWYGDLRSEVVAQSQALSLVKQPPATLRQLQLRVEGDVPAMEAVLRSRGYLEASVVPDVATNRSPVRVTFRVVKGPLYTLRAYRVIYTNTTDKIPQPPRVGLKSRSPAARDGVDEADLAALRYLKERGYPSPRKISDVITRDDTNRNVRVDCLVDPGPRAKLGAVEFSGNKRVDIKYMRRRIPWTPGDRYSIGKVEELEKDLLRSGLFRSVRVSTTNSPDTLQLPVKVDVAERPFRTVRAGISYYTDEGIGGETSWENRNVFGGAEVFSATLFASQIKYGAKSRFTEPDFTARNTDLHLEVDAAHESPDAYDSQHARVAVSLEKRMKDHFTLTGGTAFEHDEVEQKDEFEKYDLLSLPLRAELDRRNDKLDPCKGALVRLTTEPYHDVVGSLQFLKSQVDGSYFIRLSRSPQTVLATRATLGAIDGATADEVPADKRFYAGGGGTVRGYKYQSIGPLEDGEPVGGKSLAAVSTELRLRLSRTLGAACFVDGGTAYPDSMPDQDTPFLWAVGTGVRYYLGFAPLRVDIAFPLQRREGIDAAFQIYVSLGQAF